jgi:hypothetical protein
MALLVALLCSVVLQQESRGARLHTPISQADHLVTDQSLFLWIFFLSSVRKLKSIVGD